MQLLRPSDAVQTPNALRCPHTPNWNFNVSHEGDFVVLASEPVCICGVDVAAPAQLRSGRGGAATPMRDYLALFSRQLTSCEAQRILGAGSEGASQPVRPLPW